jgi:hypothetical protein
MDLGILGVLLYSGRRPMDSMMLSSMFSRRRNLLSRRRRRRIVDLYFVALGPLAKTRFQANHMRLTQYSYAHTLRETTGTWSSTKTGTCRKRAINL